MTHTVRFACYMLLAVVLVLLDQWTKALADSQLQYGNPVEILPVFNLMLQYNQGAAFSFLSDAGGWQRWFFTAISTVVSVALVVWVYKLKPQEKMLAVALTFILGGAIGNLWDRVMLGHVVDFISVHWQDSYFPAFNIADSAITIGAILMILDMIVHPEHHKGNKD
ncbi:signal peptidase II [Dasania sp. GY-MA-18]|uniref:Lipoprotein signal peptidase n=1 Tax=Dasania phycosphaerae TaxID=2950436 RepID=A0A9J6RPD3_9GAMM|nr:MULTISPECIES: signal peptidase II [Dasania]MCR8923606.1 signal peptidase II [Dasania sp. GY-MA-18]MCZ0866040.1 signal peptidase II [Dasania phycosphaerae]MCZ0869764.1 signal peptidase II [Dasania phycosphaerae]